jgi:adenylate cyclase
LKQKLLKLWQRVKRLGHYAVRVTLGLLLTSIVATHLSIDSGRGIRELTDVELKAYDIVLRQTMPRTPDPRVVIVDIDEKSIGNIGRWPWSRNLMAQLVRQSFDKYQARVMAFDISFAEPDNTTGLRMLDKFDAANLSDTPALKAFVDAQRKEENFDRIFADTLVNYPVVLGFALVDSGARSGALPKPFYDLSEMREADRNAVYFTQPGYVGNMQVFYNQGAVEGGHFYPDMDDDGIIRRIPLAVVHGTAMYMTFTVPAVSIYLGNLPTRIDKPVKTAYDLQAPKLSIGQREVNLDVRTTVWIPYRGPQRTYTYVSASDIINGTLSDPSLIKDKLLIVGTSAAGLYDLRSTPTDHAYPGVEVHANLASALLDGTTKSRPIEDMDIINGMIVLTLLVLCFLVPRLSAVNATMVTLAVMAIMFGIAFWAWSKHVIIPWAVPALFVFGIYVLNMAYGYFTEARAKRQITNRFGEYIPKELVEEMAQNPDAVNMEGDSRQMTVLFSDVRSFTTISEGLDPKQLSDLMNNYLTPMTNVIQSERGTIDKYIGDAIMCFWGAPLPDNQHAAHGVNAALDMQKKVRELWPEFEKRGWPKLEIGVGLNTGTMSVGNMGSSFRRAYTVMGDAVNLASRLEGITKEYGVGIVVSESVVKGAPGFVYRELDRIRVKGKLEPVTIYEPIGRAGEVSKEGLDEVDTFHRALDFYRSQRWDDADMMASRAQRFNPEHKLYKLFKERTNALRKNPPAANWDGVFTFEHK